MKSGNWAGPGRVLWVTQGHLTLKGMLTGRTMHTAHLILGGLEDGWGLRNPGWNRADSWPFPAFEGEILRDTGTSLHSCRTRAAQQCPVLVMEPVPFGLFFVSLLSTYCMLGSIIGDGVTRVNKMPWFLAEGETGSYQTWDSEHGKF